ncbi:MAG: hypothetical protein IJN97_07590 [Oscillospiraceae bacterium]|nr:hypothetical protein [Oscillospiraceae bacterium]MBQ7055071.1 hypothetical protein [Oscillospiraceae bacterium]
MKRIMSFILAIAMVVGFVPAVFAADTDATEEYKYVFSNAAHTGTSVKSLVNFADGNGVDRGLHTLDSVAEGYDAWGYVAQSTTTHVNGLGSDISGARISVNRPGGKDNPSDVITFNPEGTDKATALCLEIKIETGGEFTPIFDYLTDTLYGPIVELYLISTEGIAVPTNNTLSDFIKTLDTSYRIGVVDTSIGTPETLRSLKLSAGNYYFIIVLNGENTNVTSLAETNKIGYHYCQPKSLTLSPVAEATSYTYDFTTNAVNEETAESVNNDVFANNGVTVYFNNLTAFGEAPTVDPQKTEKWSIANTRYVWNKHSETIYSEINSDGLKLLMYKPRYFDEDAENTDMPTASKWTAGNCNHVALVLNVPKTGEYTLSMYNDIAHFYGGFTEVSIGYADALTKFGDANVTNYYATTDKQTLGWHDSSTVHNGTAQYPAEKFSVNFPTAGNYWVIFATPNGTLDRNSVLLENAYQTFNLTKITLEEVTTQPGDAEVNVDPGNAEAESGKAIISNEVSVLAKDIDGNEIENAVTKNGSSATAEKTVGNYEFLYWAKGIGKNQKKVSTDLTYNFTNESEKLWLYAIYRNTKAVSENAIFYNANGDIISTAAITAGKVTTPALTNVSLAGYGAVKGWKYAVDGVTYGANEEVTVSGDALFVAEYDELNTSIDITVENGTITVEDGKEKPLFGDKVTVTAPLRDGTKLFNYWMKGDEIVSFDREYSFCAWEACTLEAVYTDYVPLADSVRKIILGKAGSTYVAEFIGFDGDDVLERGIAFATSGTASCVSINRAVMTRKDLNHLATFDDISATSVVGYVIDKAGNVYYSK